MPLLVLLALAAGPRPAAAADDPAAVLDKVSDGLDRFEFRRGLPFPDEPPAFEARREERSRGLESRPGRPPLPWRPTSVASCSGQAAVASPWHDPASPAPGMPLRPMDRILTGPDGKVVLRSTDVTLGVGADSSLQFLDSDRDDGPTRLLLVKGRLHLSCRDSDVELRTPTGLVRMGEGTADVVIRSLQTLVALREGRALTVSTEDEVFRLGAGRYALVTLEGGILIYGGKEAAASEAPARTARRREPEAGPTTIEGFSPEQEGGADAGKE